MKTSSLKQKSAAVSFSDVSVTYGGDKLATENVSFTVPAGSLTVLIGPNGSGKSSLLKSLLGIVDYTGQIQIFGQEPRKSYPQIGYVPQRFSFDPTIPITVQEFLSISFLHCDTPVAQRPELLMKSLQEFGALELVTKQLSQLSGGQLQRVLLARAFLHQPRLVILDEPETGIDVEGGKSFYELLFRQVKQAGLTAIIASHELEIVSKYADQVVCINKQLLCSGAPKQILSSKNLASVFGSHVGMYVHH